MRLRDKSRVPGNLLAPDVDPTRLGFRDTSELSPLEDTIGQDRAVRALEFGLQIPSVGFNIYVAGPMGTGKGSLVRQMVKKLARTKPSPPDWCYVNNFQDASRPTCLSLPSGQGRIFQQAMATFINALRRDIPAFFESKKYLDARAKIVEDNETRKKTLFQRLTELGKERGFRFEETPVGFGLVPLRNGQPMSPEEVEGLSEADQQALTDRRRAMEEHIRDFHAGVHAIDHETEQRILDLDRQCVGMVMQARFEALRNAYQSLPLVTAYLDHVREDVIAKYKDFLPRERTPFPIPNLEDIGHPSDTTRYQVNVMAEHAPDTGAPVVEENHPTYANLVGKIERKGHLGVMYTDFTEIKAGALLHASGGYLILHTLDLLKQPFSWDALKRAITTREVIVEDPSEFIGFSTTGLKPEPIPVDVKVILLGPPFLYHLLHTHDEIFPKIFKVKADFDIDLSRDDRVEQQYARFIARVCRDEQLPHFQADAVAEVIRHGFRLAESHDRLSLRFSLVSDLIREAAYWAKQAGRSLVSRDDVDAAISRKRDRSSLPEQWIQDEIREGSLLMDLTGDVIGQVNGLSVHDLGDYAFGRPCRITAQTSVGTEGVIDIQREAELSGSLHSKGVMTLAGFLAGRFAGTFPFATTATVTFEQTYSEVEGDSAAVAELIAILSSLAELPVHQELAVTGSVNQIGEVQPIGGVNEKIEGFFDACKRRGLTGNQGVIIPARNFKHLALRRDVVEAVDAGQFAVYGVNTLEEAFELLTSVPAGERDEKGAYPPDSGFGQVAQRLAQMAQAVADWSAPTNYDRPLAPNTSCPDTIPKPVEA